MSSCNAMPVILEINPIKTAGCVIKESCNGRYVDLIVSLVFTVGCAIKGSCNAILDFFQYPGFSFLHSWTRITFSGLRK